MRTITILPNEVVAHIAAGEVIERPAYVIKELIDNAIDAHAEKISIEIHGSAFEKITVTDTGIGMSKEDLTVATTLHATSKLKSLDQLDTIGTLGFRGEALASIAAVSTLTIATRTTDSLLGFQFISSTSEISPIGMSPGTRVEVTHLFQNVPARRKFLKTTQTERRVMIDTIVRYAIAHPHIHFVCKINGKTTLDRKPEPTLTRFLSIQDSLLESELIPFRYEDAYIQIHGLVAKPHRSFSSPREQYLIINNRPISDKLLSAALHEAFGSLLPSDHHPAALLHITIPVQLLDVNVHPRKEVVHFANPDHVFLSVKTAVFEALQGHVLTYEASGWKNIRRGNTGAASIVTRSIAGSAVKAAVLHTDTLPEMFEWKNCTQLHKTYICVQTSTGMLLVDQHAAHERILFEKLLVEFKQQRASAQSEEVTPPLRMSVAQSDGLVLDEYSHYFLELGFHFQKESATRYLLTHMPSLFLDRNPEQIIEEVISDIHSGNPIRSTDTLTHRMLTFLACRSAIKAGETLSKEKMRSLIEELQTTTNKYTCPHGRPTMVSIPKKDLDSLFMRA